MSNTSIAQQLRFTLADMVSLGGGFRLIDMAGSDHWVTYDKVNALEKIALETQRPLVDIVAELQADLPRTAKVPNGETCQRLQVSAANLVTPVDPIVVKARGGANFYRISRRLNDAIEADAVNRDVGFSKVFFEIQCELHHQRVDYEPRVN